MEMIPSAVAGDFRFRVASLFDLSQGDWDAINRLATTTAAPKCSRDISRFPIAPRAPAQAIQHSRSGDAATRALIATSMRFLAFNFFIIRRT